MKMGHHVPGILQNSNIFITGEQWHKKGIKGYIWEQFLHSLQKKKIIFQLSDTEDRVLQGVPF